MTGLERVTAALSHREADRVPLYVWVFNQPGVIDDINTRFGDFDTFADTLDLDLIQAFPAGGPLDGRLRNDWLAARGETLTAGRLTLDQALEVPLRDPLDDALYEPIRRAVEHDRGRRGRAVFVQTPGVFECGNGFVGIEQHLLDLALEPDKCLALHRRIADWACVYIDRCADLGVDVIHVSDDWGMQTGLLFRRATWERCIAPETARIAAAAKARGLGLSLHSDGNITELLDDIVRLGFDLIHPCQESAGMNMLAVKQRFAGRLALYGGLDVQTVLGRGESGRVADEVRRLLRTLKPGGGYIFCTSHMVQPGTPLDEVLLAYEVAREEAVY